MHCATMSQRFIWKQILSIGLVEAWLLGLLCSFGCGQSSQVREDNNIISSSRRPIDVDTSTAKNIGLEALEKIGYNEIVRLSERAGFIEQKLNMNVELASNGPIVASGFVRVFSRYAVTAAVTSQADSPLPGPADIAALGVVVIGLVDAGLLDGYLFNALEERLSSKARTDRTAGSAPVPTTVPTATSIPTAVPIPADPEVRQTCGATYPSHRTCSSLPADYTFSTAGSALVVMKTALGDKSLRTHNPEATESGPCPDTGTHYNVRQGRERAGSITCCPCCIDGPAGSALSTRCRIHW